MCLSTLPTPLLYMCILTNQMYSIIYTSTDPLAVLIKKIILPQHNLCHAFRSKYTAI